MRTFVIGDIHGAYNALQQCLKRSGFDYQTDRLIALGDVCDRGSQVKESIDELLKIKNCVYILGNHDAWALDWAIKGQSSECWLGQGGVETISSYKGMGMPKEHIQFLVQAPLWFVEDNKLFVHGGFNPDEPVDKQDKDELLWNRQLIEEAWKRYSEIDYKFGSYDEIYVGHTPTQNFGLAKPFKLCNVWAMDTGAGWAGTLTIMDIKTKEYWQSDSVLHLYPDS